MFAEKSSEIWKRIEVVVQNEGLDLYDLELLGGILKITLYSKNGVTSGDCSKICKRLVVLATVEGEDLGIGASPHIEVNSPGVNRVLRVKDHIFGAVGERVKLALSADDKPEELTGELQNFDGEFLVVVTEEGSKKTLVKKEWKVPYSEVKKARTDFKF